ncbi:CHRD domain-containing protein [Geomonas sp.]|uniref:CHRD domain-containing protein n=1 Tax=Geomonas sp. TaxID=2651584 RepID=UPI002B4A3F9B|nr:CHRD domain-containing protein [Geomonas sp.]HJV35513.1 CHRD domain-containing protein [Geomonas sp.]
MGRIKLLLVIILAAFLGVSTVYAFEHHFKAKLTPKEETKAPESKASGKAEFEMDDHNTKIKYEVHVKNIVDANAAHIHIGKKGEDGPPVATLFSGKKAGKFSGTLAKGKIGADDLMGDYKGKMDDLFKLMKSGGAYVNVHTDANPDGEIRGQIK